MGASISPDGKYAAALTLLPSAGNYPMDDIFECVDGVWQPYGGGSGLGTSWSSISDRGNAGVLRFGGEAPAGASIARIVYEGREVAVPVRHGHFLFVAWDTTYAEEPHVQQFD